MENVDETNNNMEVDMLAETSITMEDDLVETTLMEDWLENVDKTTNNMEVDMLDETSLTMEDVPPVVCGKF